MLKADRLKNRATRDSQIRRMSESTGKRVKTKTIEVVYRFAVDYTDDRALKEMQQSLRAKPTTNKVVTSTHEGGVSQAAAHFIYD